MPDSDPTYAALVEALAASQRMNEALTEQVAQLQAALRHQTRLMEGLQRQVGVLLAQQQGERPPPPPRTDRDDSEPPASPPSVTQPPPRRKKTPPKKKTPKRKALSKSLERRVEEHAVCTCPDCGSGNLAQLAPEVSEKLEYVRAHVRVHKTVRQSVRCRGCGALSTAPLPPQAVPGGSMKASMLAHVAYAKCGLHMPLVRIAQDLRHLGVSIAKSTMCDAMKHVSTLIRPVVDRIVERLFRSPVIHTDGTGLKVLEPGTKGSHRGQFATYCNDELTVYDFSPSKHGEHFAEFLRVGQEGAYKGKLVADAASNMNLLFTDKRITECGCWYHLRKKFEEARPGAPLHAEEGLAWVGCLFDVDAEADDAGDDLAARLARRREHGRPLVAGFEKWMDEVRQHYLPDEELFKATQYYRNHRDALVRFLEDAKVPLSNNLAERELGVIGRGRKAYLFAGSDEGGRRLGHIYTVVRTCQRMGIDPFAYLADVLPRLSVMKANRGPKLLDQLVPWDWKPA